MQPPPRPYLGLGFIPIPKIPSIESLCLCVGVLHKTYQFITFLYTLLAQTSLHNVLHSTCCTMLQEGEGEEGGGEGEGVMTKSKEYLVPDITIQSK